MSPIPRYRKLTDENRSEIHDLIEKKRFDLFKKEIEQLETIEKICAYKINYENLSEDEGKKYDAVVMEKYFDFVKIEINNIIGINDLNNLPYDFSKFTKEQRDELTKLIDSRHLFFIKREISQASSLEELIKLEKSILQCQKEHDKEESKENSDEKICTLCKGTKICVDCKGVKPNGNTCKSCFDYNFCYLCEGEGNFKLKPPHEYSKAILGYFLHHFMFIDMRNLSPEQITKLLLEKWKNLNEEVKNYYYSIEKSKNKVN